MRHGPADEIHTHRARRAGAERCQLQALRRKLQGIGGLTSSWQTKTVGQSLRRRIELRLQRLNAQQAFAVMH